ncbi:MAG: hypothetical protein KZQ83_07230 [gamma proteobacterium symbiont of Taylorina sp.]|nr:hypothetical protein [gamma proteobacterium symbiont of Taylorina sp.]
MIKSACDVMKKSIMISAILLFAGTSLEVVARFISYESILPVIFIYTGFFAISFALMIVLATFIAIMIPKVNQRLDSCQH